MKKLLVFSVIFAVAMGGAVFAEVSIGGGAGMGMQIIYGDTTEKGDDDPAFSMAALGPHWAALNATWAADDGSAGAKLAFNPDAGNPAHGPVRVSAGVWWRPLELLRVKFWQVKDEGDLGRGNAIDWGYQANSSAGNVVTMWGGGWNSFSNATLRSGNGFFGGTSDGPHLLLELFPVDGLNVGIAWEIGDAQTPEDFFKGTFAQVKYDINGIGNFAVSYTGANQYQYWMPMHEIAVDFFLTSLPGMGIGVGAKIPIFKSEFKDENDWITADPPIEIGLEYTLNQWSSEAFQLFARAGVLLPSESFGDITSIGVDINPSYDLGIFRVFFDLGIALATQKDNDDSDFFWHFSPYLRKSIGIGDLYFGLNFWNGTPRDGYEGMPWGGLQGPDNTKIINFSIPIFFETSF